MVMFSVRFGVRGSVNVSLNHLLGLLPIMLVQYFVLDNFLFLNLSHISAI